MSAVVNLDPMEKIVRSFEKVGQNYTTDRWLAWEAHDCMSLKDNTMIVTDGKVRVRIKCSFLCKRKSSTTITRLKMKTLIVTNNLWH